jgi:hypothetical protein
LSKGQRRVGFSGWNDKEGSGLLVEMTKLSLFFLHLIALSRLAGNSKKAILQTAILFCKFALQTERRFLMKMQKRFKRLLLTLGKNILTRRIKGTRIC